MMGYSKTCQVVHNFLGSCSNDIAKMVSICVQFLSVRAPGKTTTDSLLSQIGYEKPIDLILIAATPANDDSLFSKEHFFTRIGDLWNGWNGPFIWFLARIINARVIAIAHSKYSRVT